MKLPDAATASADSSAVSISHLLMHLGWTEKQICFRNLESVVWCRLHSSKNPWILK